MNSIISALMVLCLGTLTGCGLFGGKEAAEKKIVNREKREEAKAIEALDQKAKIEKPVSMVPKHVSDWSYRGENGPQNWSRVNGLYFMCEQGKSQSPIDLIWKQPIPGGELEFYYQAQKIEIVDDGHTIKVIFPAGNKVSIRGDLFELKELQFHATSEHAISGKKYPMEMQLVHENAQGKLAVISVFFEVGQKNEFIATLWHHIPSQKHEKITIEGVLFNPLGLLPKAKTYYHYLGSLTTPPCSEGVNWNIFNTSVEISQGQLEAFRSFYEGNYRPLQKLNGRSVVNF